MGDRLMNDGAGLGGGPMIVADNRTASGGQLVDPYQINVTIIDRVVNWTNNGTIFDNDGNDDSSGPSMTQFQLNLVGYLLMSSFLLILSVVLGLLVYSIVRRRHLLFLFGQDYHHRNGNDGASSASAGGTPSRSMLLRIQRRYETIEHWIITKNVQPHDDFCDKVVTNFGHHRYHPVLPPRCTVAEDGNTTNTTSSCSSSADESAKCSNSSCSSSGHVGANQQQQQQQPCVMMTNSCQAALESDHDQRECPICMSPLTAGQIVSWSANEKCSHVYHHQCIKEWLLRHVECCLCKNTFLPVDMKKGQQGAKEQAAALQELSCEYAAASATSYYCVRTGLIRIPRSVRCTKTELTMLEQRIFEGTVPPAKLASMRGSREGSTSRTNDDNVLLVPTMVANDTGYLATEATSSSSTTTVASFDGHGDDQQVLEPSVSSTTILPRSSVDQENDLRDVLSAVSLSHDQQQPHEPQSENVESARSVSSRDVELGRSPIGDDDQELLTASDHLELEKSRFGDNRCCILDDSSADSVEVKETSSSGHILEEEELSDHQLDTSDRSERE